MPAWLPRSRREPSQPASTATQPAATRRQQLDVNIIIFLLIGLIAGWLAGVLVKGRGFGIAGDIVVGIIGAFVGAWVYGLLGLTAWGLLGQILMATIGACLLLFVIRLVKRA